MVSKAIFLDRDGVLNYLVDHHGEMTAPWHIDEFEIIDGAKEAVDIFKKMGYYTFVVTNQPDVNDGYLPLMHLNIMTKICQNYIGVDSVLCAHERGSAWYKPNNGMIETFIRDYNIDRGSSYIVGDRWKDIVAGHKSKLTTMFVGDRYISPDKYKNIQPDFTVDNVLHAAMIIKELNNDD